MYHFFVFETKRNHYDRYGDDEGDRPIRAARTECANNFDVVATADIKAENASTLIGAHVCTHIAH